jgi:hypothetical protein
LGALLGLPPLLTLAIVLAVAAYIVFRIVSTGRVQPLEIVILVVLGLGFVRSLYRISIQRKAQASENEDD